MTAALEYMPGVGRATKCSLALYHSPKPTRFVWHHVLPQVCGGSSSLLNLAQVCDNCHYTVHALMSSLLVIYGAIPSADVDARQLAAGSRKQRALAVEGYKKAVAQGTANRIPNEGGIIT